MDPTVAVDAMGVSSRSKGVPRTLVNLLRELPRAEPRLSYVALVDGRGERTLRERGVEVEVRVHRPRGGLGWELGGSARAAREAGALVLYTMREVTFRRPGGGVVRHRRRGPGAPAVVLHLHEPPWVRRRLRGWPGRPWRAEAKDALLSALVGPALRRADRVVASSAATGEALASRFGVHPDVVPLGVDPAFLGAPGPGERERFLLHLSSGDPRENTPRVLAAWGRARLPGFRLVVAGVPSPLRPVLRDLARRSGAGEVEVLGWVTDRELARLYGRAWALVGPSLYEGFGLEGLEAMALGTPVVAGDVPACREVLGDAALFADPRSVPAIEEAVRRLTGDPVLWRRLHRAGPGRARAFRWAATATRLAGVLARVVEGAR